MFAKKHHSIKLGTWLAFQIAGAMVTLMGSAIEYGVPTDRCGLQIRLGIEKGYFRDEGIDLKVRIVFGGPELASEFDSGRLKIGELGTPPGLTALANGARYKVVGSGVRRGAVLYFVAHKRFSNWQDLRGARLGALSRGSCSDWYMRAILTHHSIDPNGDVTIIGLGSTYPQVLSYLASGELDGAIISEPHVTMGEEAGSFNVWLGLDALDFIPRMQWTIAVANNDFLLKEPNLVTAVLRGCRRSYHYAADHRDEWADFGASHFGISRQAMARSINREFNSLHFDCRVDRDGMEAAIALQRNLGAITQSMKLSDIIDPRFDMVAS
jgi:ABC-type nitrate/sulfonate/bicarbonate transport system substrate-binding protein